MSTVAVRETRDNESVLANCAIELGVLSALVEVVDTSSLVLVPVVLEPLAVVDEISFVPESVACCASAFNTVQSPVSLPTEVFVVGLVVLPKRRSRMLYVWDTPKIKTAYLVW